MLDKLISAMSAEIIKKYKISQSEVEEIISNNLSARKDLTETWENETELKNIHRTKEYKDFFKKLKKEIYFNLRTYQRAQKITPVNNLESTHLSTKERVPYAEELILKLDAYLNQAQYIIDLGGGMFPVTVPLEKYSNLKSYVWIDKDKQSYEKLVQYKIDNGLEKLKLYCEEIGAKNWEEYLPADTTYFNIALMLKLIPVINRQQNDLLKVLATTPANLFFITGSKEAMVKKQNIEKREDAVIKSFIQHSGRTVVEKIDIPNEFGYIVK